MHHAYIENAHNWKLSEVQLMRIVYFDILCYNVQIKTYEPYEYKE